MRQLIAVVVVIALCSYSGIARGEEAAKDMSPAAPAAEKAAATAQKRVVDEKTLTEIKRQLRSMREEMAELEEKLDRATTVREGRKVKE